jgi:hypothetical protein
MKPAPPVTRCFTHTPSCLVLGMLYPPVGGQTRDETILTIPSAREPGGFVARRGFRPACSDRCGDVEYVVAAVAAGTPRTEPTSRC